MNKIRIRNKTLRIRNTDSIKTYMSSSSSFIVMVVEGLHFIRQKNALRAPACSLQQNKIFQLEKGIRIRMILGLTDPHPDSLVTSMDPAPNHQAKIVKQTFISTVLYDFLSLQNDVNVPVLRIRIRIRICMFLGFPDPHPDLLVRGTDPEDPDPHPDPYKNVTDPQHC
jgi:hypothetical protein